VGRVDRRDREYYVVYKDIKNLHIGVYPPMGRVRVAAPTKFDDDNVRLAVIRRLPWIRSNASNSRLSSGNPNGKWSRANPTTFGEFAIVSRLLNGPAAPIWRLTATACCSTPRRKPTAAADESCLIGGIGSNCDSNSRPDR
jgi:hypothetical protein